MTHRRTRPLPTKKEWIGILLIVVLMFVEYFISLSILSGEMDTQFIYSLDLTGQLAIEGVRWANGSITYRDLMIPVYITANVFLYVVILVTFMTRDWENIAEWESNIGYKWVFIYWGIAIFLYLFVTSFIGSDEMIHDINELQRLIERPGLNNKYNFILILMFFTYCGYEFSMALAVTILKVKKSISNQLRGE